MGRSGSRSRLEEGDEGFGEPARLIVTLAEPPQVLLLAHKDHVSFTER